MKEWVFDEKLFHMFSVFRLFPILLSTHVVLSTYSVSSYDLFPVALPMTDAVAEIPFSSAVDKCASAWNQKGL